VLELVASDLDVLLPPSVPGGASVRPVSRSGLFGGTSSGRSPLGLIRGRLFEMLKSAAARRAAVVAPPRLRPDAIKSVAGQLRAEGQGRPDSRR